MPIVVAVNVLVLRHSSLWSKIEICQRELGAQSLGWHDLTILLFYYFSHTKLSLFRNQNFHINRKISFERLHNEFYFMLVQTIQSTALVDYCACGNHRSLCSRSEDSDPVIPKCSEQRVTSSESTSDCRKHRTNLHFTEGKILVLATPYSRSTIYLSVYVSTRLSDPFSWA